MYGLRRVVITGMGAICSVGHNVEEFWNSLLQGNCGIDRITHFDPTAFATQIAAEVKNFDAGTHFNSKDVKKMDRYCHFAIISAREALKNSGLDLNQIDPTRMGVIYGSGIGGISSMEKQHGNFISGGPSKISPFVIPMMIIDLVSGLISMEFNLKGPNFSVVSACATGSHCIGEAGKTIALGEADLIVAGASEAAITHLGIGGFTSMKALSRNNSDPKKSSRPFDLNRDGFVMGEGGGTIVLEEYEHAKARGAKIYAELVGYGASGDAHHMTQPAPEGEGAARAIKLAIKSAGISPEVIGYYNAHGTSTHYNDLFETQALKSVLGQGAYKLPVSSTKALTGHMLGAAGAVELIACLKALETGILPPTWNYETPDPECDLDYIPNQPRESKLTYAMSGSLGFGGHNVALIISKI